MNGLMIKLPIAVTDTSLPILYPDSRMSKGSLILLDFNRTYGDVVSPALPVNGNTINNIAWETAASMIPGSIQSELSFPVVTNGANSGTYKTEWSAKKGLHLVNSQVSQLFNNYLKITVPQKIIDYLLTNKTHHFFISTWENITRARVSGVSYGRTVLLFNTTGINLYAKSESGDSVAGLKRTSYDRTAPSGDPTDVSNLGNILAHIGNGGINAYSSAGGINLRPSTVHYASHVIDLTVSGQTFAEADAIDLAAYNDAFATGGRLNGDTYTPAATLLA